MSERKVALVIDGMSTLGTAISQHLQRSGMIVAVSYPEQQRHPEAWLAAQRDEGCSFHAWPADVGAFDACAALVARVLAMHGRLDVLVNLAAAPGDGDTLADAQLAHLSQPAWRAALRLVLDAAFNLNKQVLPAMLDQQWGRIIQVASAPAWPLPGRRLAASHAAANAALHGLARALALETARHGITVNTVMPGYLRRPGAMLPGTQGEDADDAAIAAHIPVGRLGDAAEVAALVGYLASDTAAFVTGAQIAINGGQHMY